MERTGVFVFAVACLAVVPAARAATNCVFTTTGATMTLTGDCTTDSTILIPDGMTLDGNGFTITAVDPPGGHFQQGIVQNAGATAHVVNLTLTTLNLSSVCEQGWYGLRGIFFAYASGTIADNTILNINRGASGCDEGNAIDIQSFGSGPRQVEITRNTISNYQKNGIYAAGSGVNVNIRQNNVGSSATQAYVPANAVMIQWDAFATVEHNQLAGNTFRGYYMGTLPAATAVQLDRAAYYSVVRNNKIMDGNADIGILADSAFAIVDNNRVFETGEDTGNYEIGIATTRQGTVVTNNKVRGFDLAYFPYEGDNKTIPTRR